MDKENAITMSTLQYMVVVKKQSYNGILSVGFDFTCLIMYFFMIDGIRGVLKWIGLAPDQPKEGTLFEDNRQSASSILYPLSKRQVRWFAQREKGSVIYGNKKTQFKTLVSFLWRSC